MKCRAKEAQETGEAPASCASLPRAAHGAFRRLPQLLQREQKNTGHSGFSVPGVNI